jgi:type IV pilus assembly protein PilW
MSRNQLGTKAQSGFSILELMIALMLGLVVVAGIVQLFVGNSRTYDIVNAQARLQENARYSFEFISEAARNAGYFGCAPEPENILNGLIGAEEQITEYLVYQPLEGHEAVGDGTYVPGDLITLPRTEGAVNLNVHIAGNGIDRNVIDPASDVVVFRSVQQPVARLNQFFQPQDLSAQIMTPGGLPAFGVNDVVLIADCEQAIMLRATAAATTPDTTTLTFTRVNTMNPFDNGVQVITPSLDTLPWTNSVLGIAYSSAATVGLIETTIFFIAPSVVQNNRNQDVNSLWRKVGSAAPVELVQGVDNMQIIYGEDINADNAVDSYKTFDQVTGTPIVIRVQLDISSPDVVAEIGGQLSRTYSKTISLRNFGV